MDTSRGEIPENAQRRGFRNRVSRRPRTLCVHLTATRDVHEARHAGGDDGMTFDEDGETVAAVTFGAAGLSGQGVDEWAVVATCIGPST